MDYIYTAIIDRFNSTYAQQLYAYTGLNPIRHIDRFKGQYLNPDLHQPWGCPAMFLKFNITWEDAFDGKQHGNGILEVHVELENYAESYAGGKTNLNASPDQAQALADYEYYNLIHVLLQGFNTKDFSPLKRISTDEDDNPTNTNVTIIRYSFGVEDFSAYRYKDALNEPLDDMQDTRIINPPTPSMPDSDYMI